MLPALAVAVASLLPLALATPIWPFPDNPNLRVQLPYATVVGKTLTPYVLDGVEVNAWLGIPFAQPPVGDLRFKAPQPITAQLGELKTQSLGAICLQFPDSNKILSYIEGQSNQSEDCLFANIWAPATAKAGDKLPVMIWTYGGSFTGGSSSYPIYNGEFFVRDSIDDTPVILVTYNYRVNTFGFLASEDLAKEGSLNAGMKDMRFLHDWVRANIAAFGGDPNSITAFGESAGAIALGNHLVAGGPLAAKGPMFDRVIMESGAAIARTVAFHDPDYVAVANAAGCTDAATRLACLRAVPANRLLNASAAQSDYHVVIDGDYIPRAPVQSVAQASFLKVNMLLGTNTNEGTFFQGAINTTEKLTGYINSQGPYADRVRALYPVSDFNGSYFLTASEIDGDKIFECPSRAQADAYAKSGMSVYRYRWNHQPILAKLIAPQLGVFHGSEYFYVFNFPLDKVPLTEERDLAKIIGSYWRRFAKTGNPNGGKTATVNWPAYQPDAALANGGGQRLLITAANDIKPELDNLKTLKCTTWMNYFTDVWETPATFSA